MTEQGVQRVSTFTICPDSETGSTCRLGLRSSCKTGARGVGSVHTSRKGKAGAGQVNLGQDVNTSSYRGQAQGVWQAYQSIQG